MSVNGFPELHRFPGELQCKLSKFSNSRCSLENYVTLDVTSEEISLSGCRIVVFGYKYLRVNSYSELYRFPNDSKSLLLRFLNSSRNLEYFGAQKIFAEIISLSGFFT